MGFEPSSSRPTETRPDRERPRAADREHIYLFLERRLQVLEERPSVKHGLINVQGGTVRGHEQRTGRRLLADDERENAGDQMMTMTMIMIMMMPMIALMEIVTESTIEDDIKNDIVDDNVNGDILSTAND